ncbi:MAG: UDP-N-acetylmuramoyl-L-alanyl-D-glutamate--2,6-diaminopimelate ligase [Lautropia sp.]
MTAAAQLDAVARETAGWLRATLPDARARGARLRSDSRLVGAGDIFVAWPGANGDGRRHLPQAIAAGAAAVLLEAQGLDAVGVGDAQVVPMLPVPDLRERAGRIAADWLGSPSTALDVVAVTGTNGKTSCTQWIAAGCNARARRAVAGVVGTLGAGVPVADGLPHALAARLADGGTGGLTTPDALALQHLFRDFVDAGIGVAAIEASSIGLVQGRLEGTRVAVAVMTNLTRDHLDFHGSVEAYADAKARLFRWPGLKAAVFNLDDPAALAMGRDLAAGVERIGFSVVGSQPAPASAANDAVLRVCGTLPDARGLVHVSIGARSAALRLEPIGRFNLSNALAVAGVWHALGWSFDEIVAGLESLRPVPGRLQRVDAPDDGAGATGGAPGEVAHELPMVVVDYAHTPDAIANVLATLRDVAQQRRGRLWCVFGAGGNRDRGKRAPMASAAEAGADELVLTSDNPRDEDPVAILDDLCKGLSRPARLVEPDRREAIARAIALAAAGDVVAIAGKGHEDYQEVRGVRTPFSDVQQAREALGARREAGGDRGH